MSAPDADHEARIRTLEQQVAELRTQIAQASGEAAAARVLAGGADRDVSEMKAQLRAHMQALNALRETQLEQDVRLSALELEMRSGFQEMRTGFATVHSGMAHITTLLEGIAPTGPE